eukprot:TRINITY_DN6545_c0_g1_i5.p1 TRINITY_DN6545_c0_g1~~TRINITY_DN6545_c0_g1_i5.p1  ORF type:complete len:340 (+),score=70.74 TRINITY_DN6545_c0_g1_i5:156-1175(+)
MCIRDRAAAAVYFLLSCKHGSNGNINVEIAARLAAEDTNLRSQGFLTHFLTTNRAPFVIGFVLPISLIYDAFFYLRSTYIQATCGGFPALHATRVLEVQRQVREWSTTGRSEGKRMVTARPGWLSMSPNFKEYKAQAFQIKVPLYDVLELDEQTGTVRVEPQVTMGQVTQTLLPRGWTLPVLPEMDDLTCGGLICGCGIEASSHRYGLFQAICVEFELVTCDGEVVTCSAEHNPELFRAVPWSYGTLGILTAATLRVVKSKPFVRVSYTVFNQDENNEAFSKALSEATIKGSGLDAGVNEFVEGIVYSSSQAVLLTGDFVDEAAAGEIVNPIGRFYKPW